MQVDGIKYSRNGREFLRFLDLVLKCEISAEIWEAGPDRPVTAEEAVSALDCIRVREYKGVRYVTEADRRQRELLKLFGLPVPETAESGVMIFDPQE